MSVLGDSGYPLRPWLLTPLEDDPLPGSAEERYNQKHRSTRSIIERSIENEISMFTEASGSTL